MRFEINSFVVCTYFNWWTFASSLFWVFYLFYLLFIIFAPFLFNFFFPFDFGLLDKMIKIEGVADCQLKLLPHLADLLFRHRAMHQSLKEDLILSGGDFVLIYNWVVSPIKFICQHITVFVDEGCAIFTFKCKMLRSCSTLRLRLQVLLQRVLCFERGKAERRVQWLFKKLNHSMGTLVMKSGEV